MNAATSPSARPLPSTCAIGSFELLQLAPCACRSRAPTTQAALRAEPNGENRGRAVQDWVRSRSARMVVSRMLLPSHHRRPGAGCPAAPHRAGGHAQQVHRFSARLDTQPGIKTDHPEQVKLQVVRQAIVVAVRRFANKGSFAAHGSLVLFPFCREHLTDCTLTALSRRPRCWGNAGTNAVERSHVPCALDNRSASGFQPIASGNQSEPRHGRPAQPRERLGIDLFLRSGSALKPADGRSDPRRKRSLQRHLRRLGMVAISRKASQRRAEQKNNDARSHRHRPHLARVDAKSGARRRADSAQNQRSRHVETSATSMTTARAPSPRRCRNQAWKLSPGHRCFGCSKRHRRTSRMLGRRNHDSAGSLTAAVHATQRLLRILTVMPSCGHKTYTALAQALPENAAMALINRDTTAAASPPSERCPSTFEVNTAAP